MEKIIFSARWTVHTGRCLFWLKQNLCTDDNLNPYTVGIRNFRWCTIYLENINDNFLFFRENFFSFWRLFFFVSEKKKFILRLFPALKTTKLRTRARRDKISPLGAWWAVPCRVGQVKFSPFRSTANRFRDKWPQSFT